MAKKNISDAELSKALTAFFGDVRSSACDTAERAIEAMNDMLAQKKPNRMVEGIVFDVSDALEENHQLIVSRAAKLLGPAAGNEKEISGKLWKLAVTHVQDSKSDAKDRTAEFLVALSDIKERQLTYVAPNLAVHLTDGLTHFEVGPVTLLGSSLAAKRINDANENPKWSAVTGEPGMDFHEDGTADVRVPKNAWWVTVVAAADHLEEEALWYIDVLIALLRLTASDHLGPFVGGPGNVEPHPTRARPASGALTLSADGGVSAGGLSAARTYHVSPSTSDYLKKIGFFPVAEAIFASVKGTVGERVFRSLGWLARGRQASDRSERFLFFFTGLEALLSADDKSAPVIQTISRHAASLLSDEHDARIKNAGVIKKLYENRSALVHAGARKTSQRDANTIEHVLICCLWAVLDGVTMSSPYLEFQRKLSDCSYGLPFRNGWGWLGKAREEATTDPVPGEVDQDIPAQSDAIADTDASAASRSPSP